MRLLITIFLFALLFSLIQIGILSIAFDKLGLSMASAMLLLFASIAGSGINMPLFQLDARAPVDPRWRARHAMLERMLNLREGKVVVALNVGGGLIPVLFSGYLLTRNPLPPATVALAITLQSAVCFASSQPVRGIGIGMPLFIAPISAAVIALLLLPEHSAPLAYVCGTLGVLIGADLMRLQDVRTLGAPFAAIGGAGTFDGVFITGIVAVLLA